MYIFQFFARAAIDNPKLYASLYAKEILNLENSISLKYNNINSIIFDNNKSNIKKLIFYLNFFYQDILYCVKANIIPDFLLHISINVEIQKDGNYIGDLNIINEVTKTLYEALLKSK